MAKKKKKPDVLDRLLQKFSLRGFLLNQGTLFVAASVLVIAGIAFLWQNHQSTIVDPVEYELTAEKIEVPPAPRWASTDLRDVIIEGDDSNSILDPSLVSRTAAKIQSIGYVERINQIVKSKSGLKIDVQYRYPVGLIELSKVTFRSAWKYEDKVAYWPVDRQGVLMPQSLADLDDLPKICMLYPANQLPNQLNDDLATWTDINDERVRDAAAIAQYFVNDAKRIGVDRIVTQRRPLDDDAEEPFELWPSNGGNGTIIVWGNAPGKEAAAEAPLEQKLVALEDYIARNGSLKHVNGLFAKVDGIRVDIRTGAAIVVPKNKVASSGDATNGELRFE